MSTQANTRNGKAVEGVDISKAHRNLTPAEIYEHAIRRGEGAITASGPISVVTSPHTGRSPNDKFLVQGAATKGDVWWGKVNVPIREAHFDALHKLTVDYLNQQEELYVRDVFACADPKYRLKVRFVSAAAWHQIFLNNMFIRPTAEERENFEADFTVLHAPELKADPQKHGTNSGAFIVLNIEKKTILIGGTRYAGELKKSIFSVLNYLLPKQGVLSMHCSANMGVDGGTALFFGLSGTGKTTLSADPDRALIGDDEHAWSDEGVFNLEGGCYAKVIKLSKENEPDIWQASHRFGTVLENVVVNEDRTLNLDSQEITENTRSAYPIYYNINTDPDGQGGHPKNVVLLAADAWGVLPPIAKLTPEQAIYYFLSGYTAKLAGTERGVTEPQATFSACFGAVFMVWHPTKYATMLADKLRRHGARAWLVNTGWTGGAYGVGERMKLPYTRAMVKAAVEGALDRVQTKTEPVFGLAIPTKVPDVPNEALFPRETWPDKEAYDAKAQELAELFHKNFEQFAEAAGEKVMAAGPLAGRR